MSWSCKLEQVLEQRKSILLLDFIGFGIIETKPNRMKTNGLNWFGF